MENLRGYCNPSGRKSYKYYVTISCFLLIFCYNSHFVNILLVASSSFLPLDVLQCLRVLNVNVFVLGVGKTLPVRFSRFSHGYLAITEKDLKNPNSKLLATINRYCREKQIDTIIPSDMESFFFVAGIKDKVKKTKVFPVSNVTTLQTLNNKFEFTCLLEKYLLPHPKSVLISKEKDLETMGLSFPIIIKPLDMHSEMGVKKISSLKKANEYLGIKNAHNALPLIAQEFIRGASTDISFLSKRGKIIAWTIQTANKKGGITYIENDYILKITKRLAANLNYTGIGHIDMLWDKKKDKVVILEFNPRFWGSLLGSKMAGVNFVHLGMLTAHNLPIEPHIQYMKNDYSSIKNLLINLRISWKNLPNSTLQEVLIDPIPYMYLLGNFRIQPIKVLLTKKTNIITTYFLNSLAKLQSTRVYKLIFSPVLVH